MIDKSEIISVLDTEEGKVLLAAYINLYLQKNHPGSEMNSEITEVALTGIIEGLSQCTVPDDFDNRTFVLGKLATNIQEMEKDNETSEPVEETIPPRPLPTGSHYLNPAEVNWLLQYDPKVKASAKRLVKWYRAENGENCSYLDDETIVGVILDTLYKLNRRDPEIVSKLTGAGPSFFKQYEEGTSEEIVIRYFDSYAGSEDDYSAPKTSYSSNSSYSSNTSYSSYGSSSSGRMSEKKMYQNLGILFLFIFFPVGIYFLYKASQIKE